MAPKLFNEIPETSTVGSLKVREIMSFAKVWHLFIKEFFFFEYHILMPNALSSVKTKRTHGSVESAKVGGL